MTDCNRFRPEDVERYIHREMSESEEYEFFKHLLECERCGRALEIEAELIREAEEYRWIMIRDALLFVAAAGIPSALRESRKYQIRKDEKENDFILINLSGLKEIVYERLTRQIFPTPSKKIKLSFSGFRNKAIGYEALLTIISESDIIKICENETPTTSEIIRCFSNLLKHSDSDSPGIRRLKTNALCFAGQIMDDEGTGKADFLLSPQEIQAAAKKSNHLLIIVRQRPS